MAVKRLAAKLAWFSILLLSISLLLPLSLAISVLYLLKLLFPPKLYSYSMLYLFDFVHKKIAKTHPLKPNEQSKEVINQSKKRLSNKANSFRFEDAYPLLLNGFESLINDDLMKHFTATELQQWNLLTRTDMQIQWTSTPVMLIWFAGLIIRYLIILPLRLMFTIISLLWLTTTSIITQFIPQSVVRKQFYEWTYVIGMDLLVCAIAYVNYHNSEHAPTNGSICVTNHTSPLDTLILSRKQPFSLTGQKYSDASAFLQMWLSATGDHLWFDRFVLKDRMKVIEKMREHSSDKSKYPLLVFPEGTCISNNATLMFKKGSFDVPDVTIYPAAIKYDPRFADPFWNSSKFSLIHFIARLMTSWGLFCDVYYLPPQKRSPKETSIDFAKRVKAMISQKGGFIDLDYDGQLKRIPPPPAMKDKFQKEYADQLILTLGNTEQSINSVSNIGEN